MLTSSPAGLILGCKGLSGGAWRWLASSAFALCSSQEVFHKQDTNRSGSLNWAQLRAAMREAGRHTAGGEWGWGWDRGGAGVGQWFVTSWWWFSHKVVSDSCDPVDCSLPGSSVHGIFQTSILE